MLSTREMFQQLEKKPELYYEFHRVINKKLDYLEARIGYRPIWLPKPHEADENAIKNVAQYNLKDLFLRKNEMLLEYDSHETFMWIGNEELIARREENRIVMLNPAINKVQSWYDIKHAKTNKHQGVKAYNSKFLCDREYAELEVFNHGIGILDPRYAHGRMFMFHRFEDEIGESKDELTNIVKLQVDRFPRPRGFYKLEIHGYPISESDLRHEPKVIRDKL